jgi:hypothetical protein
VLSFVCFVSPFVLSVFLLLCRSVFLRRHHGAWSVGEGRRSSSSSSSWGLGSGGGLSSSRSSSSSSWGLSWEGGSSSSLSRVCSSQFNSIQFDPTRFSSFADSLDSLVTRSNSVASAVSSIQT